MELPPKSTNKSQKKLKLLLFAVLLAFVMVVVIRVRERAAAIRTREQTRTEFVQAVSNATSFDELQKAGLLLLRDDGTWVVIKSDAGNQWGNWTLAADSDGRWFETQAPTYQLYSGILFYTSHTKRLEDYETQLRAPNLTPGSRQVLEDMRSDDWKSLEHLYPYDIQHAANLDGARQVLHQLGFAEVVGLPRPRLTGLATHGATTSATTATTNTIKVPVGGDPR